MRRRSAGWMLLASLGFGAAHADGLQVQGGWVPEAPPGARVQAAYMELVNTGAVTQVVVGADSPDFAQVEIHRTVEAGGVVRMEPQTTQPIEAGATLTLAPGGLHLMLIDPRRRLTAGDRVQIRLRLDGGVTVPATAEVRRGAAAGHEHHQH